MLRQVNAQEACSFLEMSNGFYTHHSRIPDYWYFQTEQISSIGSGAIESTVKQIGRRVKISGAQWNKHNVSQVLKHRTAYLNGMLSTTNYLQN